MLRGLAEMQGIKARSEVKAELIDRLTDHLSRSEVISMNLSMLTGDERAAPGPRHRGAREDSSAHPGT